MAGGGSNLVDFANQKFNQWSLNDNIQLETDTVNAINKQEIVIGVLGEKSSGKSELLRRYFGEADDDGDYEKDIQLKNGKVNISAKEGEEYCHAAVVVIDIT